MTIKQNIFFPRIFAQIRFFSTSKPLLTDENDQDKLFEEVGELNDEWNHMDGKVETLFNNIRKEEPDFEVQDSDGEELGETEISKLVSKREAEKDDLVGRYEQKRNVATFDEKNDRKDKSLLLDYINKTTKNDIKTLEYVEKESQGVEDYRPLLIETLNELKNLEKSSDELLVKYHENDLPPISPETNENSTSKKPSNIDDYANPSTEMPSYMDPED
jgi:hypothetical protein